MLTIDYKKFTAPENRGILLDVVVFVMNLLAMAILTRLLISLMRQAATDLVAQLSIIAFCLGLAFLQPIGALLKRRRAHERKPDLGSPRPGCLFHPAFYFLSKLLFLIAASSLMIEYLFSNLQTDTTNYFGLPPWLFTFLFLAVPALAILNTLAVYFYFRKPKHAPVFEWLQSPQAESLADVCLFLNMIGYQMFWGLVLRDLTRDYSSLAGRFSTFAFTALLIYFPPRLLYLAEDGNRSITWLTMLLANVPIILRIIFSS